MRERESVPKVWVCSSDSLTILLVMVCGFLAVKSRVKMYESVVESFSFLSANVGMLEEWVFW